MRRPTNMSPAAAAPMIGHGLGSTRWYWCFGACACVSAMSLPLFRPYRGDVRLGVEHAVAEGDGSDLACRLVLEHRRIDEEGDRHVDGLPGFQPLLLEAEALDLVEVGSGLERRHVEGRRA